MEAGTTSTTLTARLPILNPGEYDLWLMRIEQYFLMTDYSLWEVILNGNKVLKRTVGEVEQEYEPTSAEEKQDRRNEMKARGTLLMALPNKDQLKFHSYKDAKLLMEAIEKRLQKLISQLEIQGEVIAQEDMNLKLLRNLPSEWKTHALIWRNKEEIETISLDDFHNNNITNEADNTTYEVIAAHTQSNPTSGDNLSNAVICAFLASQPNSPQLAREDLEQIDPNDLEEMDLQWEIVMLTIRARRFIKRTGRMLDVNSQRVGFDRSNVECYNCHKNGHFAKEYRALRNQENRGRENSRRIVTVETPTENALVAQDGNGGYDWSYQGKEEHPTNYALMAYTSSGSSSSSDSKVDSCSKSCVKAYATLKEQYDSLSSDYKKSQFNLVSYKAGLELVEVRLAHYKKNEAVFEESINVLNLEVKLRHNALVENKKKLEKAKKFKMGLGYNAASHVVESFVNSSVILQNQEYNKSKSDNGYHAVPPPYTRNFIPSKPDLMFMDEIVKSENMDIITVVTPSNVKKVESNHESADVKNNGDAVEPKTIRKNSFRPLVIKDWNSDDDSEVEFIPNVEDKTVRPSTEKIKFIKSARETVEKGNPQQKEYKEKGVFNIGCSRHMTGNKCYLTEYKDYDGGFVFFGDGLTCLFAKARIDESNLWHRRIGHINFKNINKLVKGNLVRGLPLKIFENDHSCVACQKGKQHKASCKTKLVNSISKPLHMLHMDLFGPTNVKSLMKKSYYLVVTDDFSRFSWVFFLATKDDTSRILKTFITEIENQLDHKVKVIRSDNGTEFKNSVMNQLCEMKGIKREFSVARTPQQNGVAERRNRTLIEAVRTMLVDSKLPTTFWAEAVNTACYVLNRVLVIKPHTKTPYELIRRRTPLIDFMKPFGCPVTILNTRDHLGKFDGKADEGFFVGYSMVSKAMRVFNKRTRIVEETLNIRFLENVPNVIRNRPDWLFDVDSLTISMNYVLVDSKEDVGMKPTEVNKSGASNKGEEDEQDTRNDTGIFGNAYDDEDVSAEADLNKLETAMNVSPIPTTRIDKDRPKDQIIRDLNSAIQTRRMTKVSDEHAMTLMDLPNGKRAIGTKWVFRNKKDERGIVVRNKARLVAQAYTQEEGIDYDEVFAPVAKIEAIRLFFAYASFMGFVVYQMDVKSAFLYDTIEEEVYVYQPPGFEDPYFPNKVNKVEKALYGLHQAPRAWYETLSTYLVENGFRRGTIDKTLFIKKDKCDILLVQVYVDDIIFGSTKKSLCDEFEGLMHNRFQMSSIRELTFFLGLQTASTPIETNKSLVKYEEAEAIDVYLYISMIRSLMYLTASRPDIMFAVCAYARDSSFNLEAFSDSDYAEASLDRKSTTGGCQFLGRRLISWHCKKQTIDANSTTESEYVATANCYRHNPVFHSKTKHIEIRHHFIRDSYEKKLIQVIKIHTDHNIADLLTKAFDVSRFNFLIASVGLLSL
ncbi:putative ribonuclease H-like domain-containing protein [Tanacetum coccineum]